MILHELNKKKCLIKLTVENLDDLWHLYNLILKDDLVYARTTREIKAWNESGHPVEGKRVSLTLGIRVTEVFFDRNLNRLRVRGIVVDVPERYEGVRGSHHTVSIQPNNTIRIAKQSLEEHQIKRIENACKVKAQPILILSLDDEETCIAILHGFDVEIKYEKKVKLPGKLEPEKRKDAEKIYFAETLKALREVLKSVSGQIVVVGPGFLKNEFTNYLKEKLRIPSVHVASVSSGGLSGVYEAIRSGMLLSIIKQSRLLEETQLVEKFFANLASEKKKATYGIEETEAATRYGAVETLIVVDKLLREVSGEERLRLEKIMHETERRGGMVAVLSGEHEAGEKVLSLGGIAATLRFPLQ